MRSAPWSNKDFWIYVDRSGTSRAVNMLLGQAQPQSKRPQSRIVRSAGRKPCLCVPSASPPFSREWLTACLQQTPAGFPRHSYYTDVVDLSQCVSCFCGDFPLFFACFGSDNFFPAPNQHRTFSYLRQEPGNTGSSLLLAALPHIHSKTACRGVSERQWRSAANRPSRPARLSPSAPAKKVRYRFCDA